ncbi:MAG: metalloregulator ArsR/SmtB family transcription factor [Anaerolineaceae bacterium]|nr:metalloregulator ArsR/SmtB family transcription factor [Anaerolineaceae bacterium]
MPNEELLEFFKALANANRLKLIGLLANQSYSVEQLSEILKISPSTVSHHLSYLNHVGLVSARAEGYYSIYSLQTDALEAMAHRLLERKSLPSLADDDDMEAYDRKVLRDFSTAEGRFKSIPAQWKKVEALLRFLLKQFEMDRIYTEKEVNEIIARYHADTAYFRRMLVDNKKMSRKDGKYWRI